MVLILASCIACRSELPMAMSEAHLPSLASAQMWACVCVHCSLTPPFTLRRNVSFTYSRFVSSPSFSIECLLLQTQKSLPPPPPLECLLLDKDSKVWTTGQQMKTNEAYTVSQCCAGSLCILASTCWTLLKSNIGHYSIASTYIGLHPATAAAETVSYFGKWTIF